LWYVEKPLGFERLIINFIFYLDGRETGRELRYKNLRNAMWGLSNISGSMFVMGT